MMVVWNLFLPEDSGTPRTFKIQLIGQPHIHSALVYRLDSTHGSLLTAYTEMGDPPNPTLQQIAIFRRAAGISVGPSLKSRNSIS